MNWKIRYTNESKRDLSAILEYLSFDLLEPETGRQLVHQIMEESSKLNSMPMRHPLYNDEVWSRQGVRFFLVKNYIVFYCPIEEMQTVYIIRVIYGGRNIQKQLSENIDFKENI